MIWNSRTRSWRANARRGARPLLLSALAALSLASPLRAQFSVQPVIVQLAPVHSAEVGVLHVANEGPADMQFRIYAGDFEQSESGDHAFLPLGEHSRSCATRISIFPDALTLRPGERQDVRVRMEPAAETCWSLVFVESAAGTDRGIRIGQRIGVKVYGIPAWVALEGEIADVRIELSAGALTTTLAFENLGDGPLRPEGRVELRSFNGELVARTAIEPFSVLPGRKRQVTVPLEYALPAGRYLVVPILDFGGAYLAGGQAILAVP